MARPNVAPPHAYRAKLAASDIARITAIASQVRAAAVQLRRQQRIDTVCPRLGGLCAVVADAVTTVLREAGYDVAFTVGTFHGPDGEAWPHAWTDLRLRGRLAIVDTTATQFAHLGVFLPRVVIAGRAALVTGEDVANWQPRAGKWAYRVVYMGEDAHDEVGWWEAVQRPDTYRALRWWQRRGDEALQLAA